MLPLCTSNQKPYTVGAFASTAVHDFPGDTPALSCQGLAAAQAANMLEVTQFQCRTSAATPSYPVIKLCDDSPQFTADKISDMALLWGLFMMAAIVIYGLRRLLNVFENSPHGE